MTERRFSRRQVLSGTATAVGATAVSWLLPSWTVRSPAVSPWASRRVPVPMRLVGTAPAAAQGPTILPVIGLAGFDDRLDRAGASGPFRWTGLPSAPGEASVLLSGFRPDGVTLRREGLVFEGDLDPTAIRMLSVNVGPAVGVPAPPKPVVETRRTPGGVPYTETFLPADDPEPTVPASFAGASGDLYGTVMVPIHPSG